MKSWLRDQIEAVAIESLIVASRVTEELSVRAADGAHQLLRVRDARVVEELMSHPGSREPWVYALNSQGKIIRTNFETGETEPVEDGALDSYLEEALRG